MHKTFLSAKSCLIFSLILFAWFSGTAQVTQPLISQANLQSAYLSLDAAASSVLKLDGYPDFLASDGKYVWVTNKGRIQKLSASSRLPLLTVQIPDPCGAPVVAGGYLYTASCSTNSIYRIDCKTGKIAAVMHTGISDPEGEISLAYGSGSLWILSDSTGILSRIDVKSGRTIALVKVRPHSYCACFGFGSVWVTNSAQDGSVQRVDTNTNRVAATIDVGPMPHFIAAGEGGIWTLNQQDGSVSHIDPLVNKLVMTINCGLAGTGGDIATGAGKVWVRSKNGTALLSIDPVKDLITFKYGPLCGSGAVRVAGKSVWVTAHDIHTVWILGSLK